MQRVIPLEATREGRSIFFDRDIICKLLNAIFISYKLYCKRCFHIYPRFWKQLSVALLDCV